ncbi:methyltransferase [Roseococcus sp. YIM B11640]|uniref:methyltransferase n=1 Tax=Roseococcus sp. YIM B11640 TaxID=3133973 RepID=UPI003C7A67C8
MSGEDILRRVGRYYAQRLAENGPGPRGVDWNGEDSQRLRHAQFLRLLADDPQASVLDLGCGYGDFLGFLRSEGHRGAFHGWDIAPEMIAAARGIHGDGEDRFWHVGAVPGAPADYAIASGVLNVKGDVPDTEWDAYVEGVIDVLAQSGRRGFGFNVLSLSSDPGKRRPNLHYADPARLLRHCLDRYGRHVALLQDYGLWEFTLLVRRD